MKFYEKKELKKEFIADDIILKNKKSQLNLYNINNTNNMNNIDSEIYTPPKINDNIYLTYGNNKRKMTLNDILISSDETSYEFLNVTNNTSYIEKKVKYDMESYLTLKNFDINKNLLNKSKKILDYDILILINDSFCLKKTFYDIKNYLKILYILHHKTKHDKLSIYFTNSKDMIDIKNINDVDNLFFDACSGFTESKLCKKIDKMIKTNTFNSNKCIFIIMTSDVDNNKDLYNMLNNLIETNFNMSIKILLLTENENVLNYYKNVSKNIKNIDIMDNYCDNICKENKNATFFKFLLKNIIVDVKIKSTNNCITCNLI